MRWLALVLLLWPVTAGAGLLDLLPLGWLEKRMLYHFSPVEDAPAEVGLSGVTAHRIAAEGAELVVWSAPPARPGGPVIFYLHGNAGNLGIRAGRFRQMRAEGFGLVAMGYRGSSGSDGTPSEPALTQDARLVYDRIAQLVPRGGEVILYGESLGTAVATALMHGLPEADKPAGVVLEAPFTSIPDMARQVTDVPPNLIARIRDRWDTLARAEALSVPLLVLHGRDDAVVPFAMGRRVFAAAPVRDKDFAALRGVGHLNVWQPAVRQRIWRFVRAYGG